MFSTPSTWTRYERELHRRTLRVLLRTAIGVTAGVLALNLIFYRDPVTPVALVAVIVASAVGLLLDARGAYIAASSFFTVTVLVAATAILVDQNGLRDPGVLSLPLIVLCGVLLFGKEAAPVMFAVTLLAVAAVASAHLSAFLPSADVPTNRVWSVANIVTIGLLLAGGTTVIYVVLDNADRHLAQIRRSEQELRQAYDMTLEGWARVVEYRDESTEGHSRRVAEMSERLARELLQGIPFLEPSLSIPYSHHERWDGTGYPEGLAGEEIPLAARIFSVVDHWEALTSDRPYRAGLPHPEVVSYLRAGAGTIFDPRVVRVFLTLIWRGRDPGASGPQRRPPGMAHEKGARGPAPAITAFAHLSARESRDKASHRFADLGTRRHRLCQGTAGAPDLEVLPVTSERNPGGTAQMVEDRGCGADPRLEVAVRDRESGRDPPAGVGQRTSHLRFGKGVAERSNETRQDRSVGARPPRLGRSGDRVDHRGLARAGQAPHPPSLEHAVALQGAQLGPHGARGDPESHGQGLRRVRAPPDQLDELLTGAAHGGKVLQGHWFSKYQQLEVAKL
ncbi:MAG: HD-GYP domain-containing protein [Gemmatimonadales bacterium]